MGLALSGPLLRESGSIGTLTPWVWLYRDLYSVGLALSGPLLRGSALIGNFTPWVWLCRDLHSVGLSLDLLLHEELSSVSAV